MARPRLVFINTSGSPRHLQSFRCWTSDWTAAFDVHLQSNRQLSPAWSAALQAVPARARSLSVTATDDGHQRGAIRAFKDARARFERYEWVVRLNPDVQVLYPEAFLKWMEIRGLVAVLANCNPDTVCAFRSDCPGALAHSDFQVFRPSAVNWTAGTARNAEAHATQVFRAAFSRTWWLQPRGFRDRSCRVRAGVREGLPTVVHHASHTFNCSRRVLDLTAL